MEIETDFNERVLVSTRNKTEKASYFFLKLEKFYNKVLHNNVNYI